MNRLFIASIAAFGLHGLLFFITFTGPVMRPPRPLSFQKITVSLADRKEPVVPEKKIPPGEKIEKKKNPQPIKHEKWISKKSAARPPDSVDNIINTLRPIKKKQVPQQIIKEEVPVFPVEKKENKTVFLSENDIRKNESSVEVTNNNLEHSPSAAHIIQKAVSLQHMNVPPPYPSAARRRGMEGLVKINVFVDINGKVKEQQLVQSSGYSILDKAALKAVRKWNFSPGIKDGRASEMWITVPVRFQLIDK